jgi:hypothetical protein
MAVSGQFHDPAALSPGENTISTEQETGRLDTPAHIIIIIIIIIITAIVLSLGGSSSYTSRQNK